MALYMYFKKNNGVVHLLQILVQHIRTVLPGLKARISAQLVAVAKEHATYGEISESKVQNKRIA